MLLAIPIPILNQESAFLVTTKMSAAPVIPESGLVQEGILMTPTRVEMRPLLVLTMEIDTSKPWVTSWCSETLTDSVKLETYRHDVRIEKHKNEN